MGPTTTAKAAERVLAICRGAGETALCSGELHRTTQAGGDALALIVCDPVCRKSVIDLGYFDARSLELASSSLASSYELVSKLRVALDEFSPSLVLAPSRESDPLLARAVAAAIARQPARRVRTYDARGALGAETSAAEHFAATRVAAPSGDPWAATAVISTWNKVEDVCENLDAIRAQTRPFASVVVVDNCSRDATAARIVERYPEVRLTVMPHSRYGACETFNIGFASAQTPLVAILDDDVVLPPDWLEKTVARLEREPETTALISTEVVEPGMPASFLENERVKRERYMSTFRGCASLARTAAIARAGYYDERLFIYGNERDLTCRLLNLGFRVLHFPEVRVFHKTPFGIKMGKRSLYFHARNAWLTQLKYAPAADLARLPWLVLTRVVLRGGKKEAQGEISDATGTIGIGKSIRETPGAWWVLTKAALNVLANVPYCLKHRAPVRAQDFELPLS